MNTKKIDGLSVIIHTKNADETLEETLKSVSFAKDVVIVDMKSKDKTVAIAEKYTKRIYVVDDVGYADPARNFGIEKAKGPWILVVDADEVVSETLAEKLPDLLLAKNITCFYLPRKNIIFNKWIEKTGWWPDYQARLFKKSSVEWEVGVHKQPVVVGSVKYLPAEEENALIHFNYRSVKQFVDKLNTYTSITAQERQDTHFERVKLKNELPMGGVLVVRTFYNQFLQRLFAQSGIDDGIHGVSLSFLQGMYELTTLLKEWEYQGAPPTVADQRLVLKELKQFEKDLNFWIADWHCKNTTGLEKIIWQFKRKFRW
jgi:glycosyltransferase involved in cell wall biosynthesis